jgi:hypothetical protein
VLTSHGTGENNYSRKVEDWKKQQGNCGKPARDRNRKIPVSFSEIKEP